MKEPTSTPTGPTDAPDFKQVRNYMHGIEQRAALGAFIKAGWSHTELAEFARAVFLAPGKTYPTRASYQYAVDKGADHPFARETLASLRAPGFTMPPFNRPRPPKFEWDAPENPEHSAELRADIEVMGKLWRNREAAQHAQPWPVEDQPIPRWLWKRLYKLRIKYHSLEDTLHIQGLSGYREPYNGNAGETNDHAEAA